MVISERPEMTMNDQKPLAISLPHRLFVPDYVLGKGLI